MSALAEIAELRREEAWLERENERLGRLQNRLSLAHPGALFVLGYLPAGSWGLLPGGWRTVGAEMAVRYGLPPVDVKGEVGVSEAVAEELCRRAGV